MWGCEIISHSEERSCFTPGTDVQYMPRSRLPVASREERRQKSSRRNWIHSGGAVINRQEKIIVLLACTGHALAHTYMLILPTLLFQLRNQFDISVTQLTLLGTICYFLYGTMALPGGFLADKLSYKAVLGIFFVGAPIAVCIVGAARSVLELGSGLALLGIFTSLYHPSGLALISHGVRARGKALGLHGMAGNLGLAFSPVIAAAIAMRFSWRHAYYFLSLPGFAVALVFIIISKRGLKLGASTTTIEKDKPQKIKAVPRQVPAIWAVISLYVAMTLTGFCYRGVITMLPTYLGRFAVDSSIQKDLDAERMSESVKQELGKGKIQIPENASISIEDEGRKWRIRSDEKSYSIIREGRKLNVYGRHAAKGGLFATMVLLVGMIGQYFGGHLSDRRRKTRLYLLSNSASLPFLILIGFTSGPVGVIVAALFAMFFFTNQPVENNLVANYTPLRLRSSGYGLKFFLSFGVGSFASGFSGFVADRFGFGSVFVAQAAVLLLAILVIIVLNITAKESAVERQS